MASPPLDTSVQGAPKNAAEGIAMGTGDIPDTESSDTEPLSSDEEPSSTHQGIHNRGNASQKRPSTGYYPYHKRARTAPFTPRVLSPQHEFATILVKASLGMLKSDFQKLQRKALIQLHDLSTAFEEAKKARLETLQHLLGGLDPNGDFDDEVANLLGLEPTFLLVNGAAHSTSAGPSALSVTETPQSGSHLSVPVDDPFDLTMNRIEIFGRTTETNHAHSWRWTPSRVCFQYQTRDMAPEGGRPDETNSFFDLDLNEISQVIYNDSSQRVIVITRDLKRSHGDILAIFQGAGHKGIFLGLLKIKGISVVLTKEPLESFRY